MTSRTTERFRKAFACLPKTAQKQARAAYRRFKRDPYHPSLHFKRVHARDPIYSVRIDINHRALGFMSRNEIIWFWIGSHDQYMRQLL